jgi:hypothetical protein
MLILGRVRFHHGYGDDGRTGLQDRAADGSSGPIDFVRLSNEGRWLRSEKPVAAKRAWLGATSESQRFL